MGARCHSMPHFGGIAALGCAEVCRGFPEPSLGLYTYTFCCKVLVLHLSVIFGLARTV